MKLASIATILALSLAAHAHADVTVKQTTASKGMGVNGQAMATTRIKGNRMRNDIVVGDRTQTSIYDLDAQKMFIFDSTKKEADVWDMGAFVQELSKNVDVSSLKASFTPNGMTRQIDGRAATGYDMDVSMAATMGGSKDMDITVTLQGPAWIVRDAPGFADYSRFYKAAVEKGWIFTDPRAAKAQPGQARAMAEMYRQIVEAGGIPYESDVQVKMSGEGPLAGLLARMGNINLTTKVVSVETTALSDDLFAPPAGYKLSARK